MSDDKVPAAVPYVTPVIKAPEPTRAFVPATPAKPAASAPVALTAEEKAKAERAAKRLDETNKRKFQLHQEISDILADHGGMESNIGIGHVYWQKCNELRAL